MIKLLLLTLIPLVALAEEKIAHKHNATPRHFGGKSYKINFVYFADADIPFSKQQELVRFAVAAVPRKIKIAKEIFSEVNPCKDMGVEDLWGVRNCYEKHTSGRLKQKQDGKKFVIAVGPAMPSFSGVRYVGGNADICGRGKGWGFGFYTFGKAWLTR
jgi:hypothetical protein